MSKYMQKTVILAKLEATPGTDPTPTGAANAMLVRNCSIKPLELSYEERNIVRGFFGSFDALPTMRKVRISFEVEYQSSGTAGTAPAWGPLMQACATTETLVAVTTATYAPNSLAATQKSVTIYYNIDGVQHMMLYGRGNATIRVKANGIPYIAFEFIGLDGGQTDVALPTPTFTAWQTPLVANQANTPTFSLHGASGLALEEFELNLGNQVEQITRIGNETIQQTGRAASGKVMIEMTSIATKNWFTNIKAATLSTFSLIHGSVAGKIMDLSSSQVQLTDPDYSNQQGIQMVSFGLRFVPSNSGNDEFSLVAK